MTTKPGGHGRGLLSARTLVEEAGGSLNLLTQTGGATAVVTLPLCEQPEWLFDPRLSEATQILILDDDESILERVQSAFKGASYSLYSDEAEFLSAAKRSSQALLLVDYSFGGSRSGLDLIQQEGLQSRAVLFSGRAQFDEKVLDGVVQSGIRALPKEMIFAKN